MMCPSISEERPATRQADGREPRRSSPRRDESSLRRAAAWAWQSTEWLVLGLLLAACIPPVLLRPQSVTIVPFVTLLLDGSWVVDTGYKAAHGVWLGRDVAFTYGPLYEWLLSAPSRWIGVSTGTIFATANMLPSLVSVLAIFAGLRLLLPGVSPWKRALLLVVMFWSPPGIRLALCLLAFVMFVRFTDAAASRTAGLVLPALGAAMLGLSTFLVSADAGLYCLAALVLSLAATAVVKARTPGALRGLGAFLAAALVCLAILVVVTNAVMSGPLDFSYWKSSLILAASYRWLEPKSITAASTWRLLGVLALGVVVLGAAWRRRQPEGNHWTLRPAFLLAGFCLALFMMQSALVRSDAIHVVNGVYPMVFLSGAVLVGGLAPGRWLSALPLAAFVAATPIMIPHYTEPLPTALVKAVRELWRPNLTCPEGQQEIDRVCYPPTIYQVVASASTYVDQHTGPGDPILVFPYQNAFGVVSRRRVAGGVLQGYLVSGDYLTDVHLAGLRKANPPLGLYLPDGTYSFGLDGVPSFTRSPGTWFYLLRHYRAESSPTPGVVGLVRDDSRDQHLAFIEEKIADAMGTVSVTKPETSVNFGQIHWPADGADFLKFRFRANYPFWWKMRKPSSLVLAMSFADGSRKLVHFVVEPNHDSEVWVYPWDEKEMAGYFSSEGSRGRTGSPLTGLALRIAPFDWISASPESISIGAVDAVQASPK